MYKNHGNQNHCNSDYICLAELLRGILSGWSQKRLLFITWTHIEYTYVQLNYTYVVHKHYTVGLIHLTKHNIIP